MTPPGLGSAARPLRVAIVGSGPSGFYAAEALLASGQSVEIDLLEKLPTPYGLVRYGVAPDHAKLKGVTAVFAQIAQDPRVRYFGHVELGRDVHAAELDSLYHAVIVATGTDGDRRLGIEGEHLQGVHAASDFVGWYNGHPACADLEFDLSQEVAVVVGQGNVALDVCRILSKPVDELRRTDIAAHALQALEASRIREIHLVGRRGPVQARFTPKELREFGALMGWQPAVDPLHLALNDASAQELRHADFLHAAKNLQLLQAYAAAPARDARRIHLHFHLAPVALQGGDRLQGVRLEVQALQGPATRQQARGTGVFRELPAGLLLRSVGYRGAPLPGLPFDERSGVLPNAQGRVLDGATPRRGWYVTGWIKRGPTGIIGTNRVDSAGTVQALLADLDALDAPRPGRSGLQALLERKGHATVDFQQWQAIERSEQRRGADAGKPSEKYVRIPDMLAALADAMEGASA